MQTYRDQLQLLPCWGCFFGVGCGCLSDVEGPSPDHPTQHASLGRLQASGLKQQRKKLRDAMRSSHLARCSGNDHAAHLISGFSIKTVNLFAGTSRVLLGLQPAGGVIL